MPIVDVVDLNNNKVGELELSDAVFGAEVNDALLWESVRHQRAAERLGTAKTKVRREVSGSGKKLWRQKGTGRARMGSIRSPLWRHGGTVHGPQPRSYDFRFPKKMMLGALRSALSAKVRDGALKVVSELALAEPRTKAMIGVLGALQLNGSILIVDNSGGQNVALGARNIPGVKVVASREVTTYDLLGHQTLLVSQAAATKLSEALA